MSQSRKRAVAFVILVTLLLAEWSTVAGAQISNDQDTVLTRAHDFLRTFYPELFGKDLLLNLHTTQSIDHSWRQISGIRFDVKLYDPLSEKMLNPPVDGKTGRQLPPPENPDLLQGLLSFNREGWLEQMYADGEVVHAKQINETRKLIESHPEWTEEEAVLSLKRAGARYGPADRNQFLQVVHLERFAKWMGRLRIGSVEFNELGSNHSGNFALTAFDWTVRAEAQFPDGMHCKYSLNFEPFEGKLISVSRVD